MSTLPSDDVYADEFAPGRRIAYFDRSQDGTERVGVRIGVVAATTDDAPDRAGLIQVHDPETSATQPPRLIRAADIIGFAPQAEEPNRHLAAQHHPLSLRGLSRTGRHRRPNGSEREIESQH